MNNNIFCSRFSDIISNILPEDPTVLAAMCGYEILFLFSGHEKIKKISFFNKAVILFLEKIVAKYTGNESYFDSLFKAIKLRFENEFKAKFIFNRTKICKTYAAGFSFSIVGYEHITNPIENIINIFKEGSDNEFIHPGHVLLYGPPGTGKTKMISDLLIKNKLDFVFVDMNLLKNAPVENLPIIFQSLSDKKTAFPIDEFDGFLPPSKLKRALSSDEEKQLSFWKTIFDSNDSKAKSRLIFCTSNYKDYLDEGILRPGRLENHFEVGNPNPDDRLKIFFSKCWEYGVSTIEGLSDEEIKHRFENCSGARIDKAVRLLAITQKKLKNESLSKKHFDEKVF